LSESKKPEPLRARKAAGKAILQPGRERMGIYLRVTRTKRRNITSKVEDIGGNIREERRVGGGAADYRTIAFLLEDNLPKRSNQAGKRSETKEGEV